MVAIAAPVLATVLALVTVPTTASAQVDDLAIASSNDVAAAIGYTTGVSVIGRGFGHGRGMGQWGALGYAVDDGWTYGQILDHYYGGTAAQKGDGTTPITVRLVTEDGEDTTIVQESGRARSSATGPTTYTAMKAQIVGPNTFDLFQSGSCAGPWNKIGTATGPIVFSVANANDETTAPATDLLGVCEPAGATRYYRGTITATTDNVNAARTVNTTTIDRYLRGVVPRESPASWGDSGSGKGMNALRAQAVAARSYALAEGRYVYAKTCDTQACQVYGGAAVRNPGSASVNNLEDSRTDRAINETAGEVRIFNSGAANGQVARTEFSASTGGYTAGGTFPAVPDDGDDVGGNNNVNWKTEVPSADIVAAYPQIGELRTIDVSSRNGLGAWGGRVDKMVIRGAKASVTVTGNEFQSKFGLKSNWFIVAASFIDVPAAAVATGSGQAYWIVARDGFVFNVNGAPWAGSMAGTKLNAPIQGMAPTADGKGYWLLGTDGGIFSFNAPFYGSTGSLKLVRPVVAMAATPTGKGYWMTAGDGGVFSFGDAQFYGSMGGKPLNQPVVGMASTPSGKGYWFVAADGGIFSFGDATFFGSTGSLALAKPIVAMAARPQGDGYWFVASDGGVFAFGGARFFGGLGGQAISTPVVGMAPTPTGLGYRLITSDGSTYAFGDAV